MAIQLQKQFILYMLMLPNKGVAKSFGGKEKPLVLSEAFNKLSDVEKMARVGRVMRKFEQKLSRVTRNRSPNRQSSRKNRRRNKSI